MIHQPTFEERIEELQSYIHTLKDIRECYGYFNRDTAIVNDEIAELEREIADVEKEREQYLQNT